MMQPEYEEQPTIGFTPPSVAPSIPVDDIPLDDDVITSVMETVSDPEYTDEQLELLGKWSSKEFLDAEALRDLKKNEWKRNREDYDNQPIRFISEIVEEAKDIPINHASTKADALRDLVCGTLFATRPYFTGAVAGKESAEATKVERLMQRVMELANLEERCKESSEDSWCTNHAILRCYFNPETSEYEIDAIEPECFVVCGGDKFGIKNSVLVGHSYDERWADILYNIEEKVYREYPLEVSQDQEEDPTKTVRLAQLFVKVSEEKLKKGKICPIKDWHIITLDIDKSHILKIERHVVADRPWYFSPSYLPSKKKGGFWSKHSLGSNMQGPHMAYNIIGNTAIYGGVMGAFPPVVVEGEMTDQVTRLKWGQAKTSYGGKVTAPYQQFDSSNLEPLMARMERVGDGVARISQAGGGQTFNKGMTATEAQIISEAQSNGVSGYVSTYAIELEEMARYVYSTFKYTISKMAAKLLPAEQITDMSLLDADVVWTATGRGQFASPALRMAQLDKIDEMSKDPRLIGQFDPIEIADSRMNIINPHNKERIFDRSRPAPPAIPQPPAPEIAGPPGPAMEGGPPLL